MAPQRSAQQINHGIGSAGSLLNLRSLDSRVSRLIPLSVRGLPSTVGTKPASSHRGDLSVVRAGFGDGGRGLFHSCRAGHGASSRDPRCMRCAGGMSTIGGHSLRRCADDLNAPEFSGKRVERLRRLWPVTLLTGRWSSWRHVHARTVGGTEPGFPARHDRVLPTCPSNTHNRKVCDGRGKQWTRRRCQRRRR